MKRRWHKIPQTIKDEFERLIRDTDLSALECGRIAGIPTTGTSTARVIIAKYRRYIGMGRWVDRTTGKVHPAQLCSRACAAEKIGVSVRTIQRRRAEGLVKPASAPSAKQLLNFTADDIESLKRVGIYPPGRHSVVRREDVHSIRELAAAGRTHTAIQKRYPMVSRRQISRIVRGERWGKV